MVPLRYLYTGVRKTLIKEDPHGRHVVAHCVSIETDVHDIRGLPVGLLRELPDLSRV